MAGRRRGGANGGDAARGGGASRGRGLDEVFHFFISEDEQTETREAARVPEPVESVEPDVRVGGGAGAGPRVLLAEPERPLHCWLAGDLRLVLGENAGPLEIAASFAAPAPFVPAAWSVCELSGLRGRIGESTNAETLYVLRPDELSEWPDAAAVDLLLPVDPCERGIEAALRVIEEVSHQVTRLSCILSGTPESPVGDLALRLREAALREHGVEVISLGHLCRGRADDRALLHGDSVLRREPTSPSARVLQEMASSLGPVDGAIHG